MHEGSCGLSRYESMAMIKTIIVMLAVVCSLIGCKQTVLDELMLFDFETDAELDQLHWQCHTLFSLSDAHVTHGAKSLKVELYPSEYPGLVPKLPVKNWQGYRDLSFDVYNDSGKPVRLGLRIDDRKNFPDHGDRYNARFILKKEKNHIVIPLETFMTTGSKRHLDLAQIHRLYIFMHKPNEKVTLYIDAIKLVR